MNNFAFHTPTRVLFGPGRLAEVGSEATGLGRRALFVTTGAWSQGIVERLTCCLQDQGLAFGGIVEVPPEPSPEAIDAAASQAREYDADLVIGVGGGSALDAAKGVAVVLSLGGRAWDYVGRGKVLQPVLPVVAVPTTAGTGSEVTPYAIFKNEKINRKAGIISPHIAPRLAVLDPELTLSLPAAITAVTGIDAFAHALESFTSPTRTTISDALAMKALELIGPNLLRAYQDGQDLEARSAMLVGSCLGGMAIAHAGTGLAHAVGATLGGFYPVEHGRVVGLALPGAVRHNAPAAGELYRQAARAVGLDVSQLSPIDAAHRLADEIQSWLEQMQLWAPLDAIGVRRADLPAMIKDTSTQNSIGNNLRPLDVSAIEVFYDSLFEPHPTLS